MGQPRRRAHREVIVELSRQEYIEVILDHHDNPRNNRKMDGAHIEASGGNPGCGDVVIVYLRLDDQGRVQDASFSGRGLHDQSGRSLYAHGNCPRKNR